jgi:hypothetical protein
MALPPFFIVLRFVAFLPVSQNLEQDKWVKITISDTINVPLVETWTLAGNLDFKSVAGNRKYDNLPEISKTKIVVGDFSKAADSRIVYFSTGDTLIESIRVIQAPDKFEYEITKPRCAKFAISHPPTRARD